MRSEHWQGRYDLFKSELSTALQKSILFLGDSITEEFPLEHYFPNLPVINRGIGGDSIDGVIERLELSAIKLRPDLLFLMIGINDIGADQSVAYMRQKYIELFSLIQSGLPQTKFYVQSLLPCTEEWGKSMTVQVREINQFLQKTCREKSIPFIDLYSRFIDQKNYLKESLSCDGLHINTNGYNLWAQIIGPLLQSQTADDQ
jgi:lysophospholipase L1-like esterase